MKSNSVMEFSYTREKRELAWTFPKTDVPPLHYYHSEAIAELDEIDLRAAVAGFKQRIADAAAISRNTETGASATVADKRAAMARVRDNLTDNRAWDLPKPGAPKVANVDALVAAIAATTGKPVIGVRAFVESKTEEDRLALSKSEKFAEAYALAIARQRPKADVSDELMAELDEISDDAE